MYKPSYTLPTVFWIIVDTLFFMWMSIMLGFFVDSLIPDTNPDESLSSSFFWITIQILLDIILLYALDLLYTCVVKRDTNMYYGLDMFTVIFFLVQTQLFTRLNLIYTHVMRRSLTNL